MSPVELVQVVIITYVHMATPVNKERPHSSGLSSSTVLDALNDNVDSECQDTDSDSDVVECKVECAGEEQELRISNDSTSSTTSLLKCSESS